MRKVIETATCDICGGSAVKSYTVSVPGRFAVADLCEKHGEPFEEALRRGTDEPRKRSENPPPKRQTSHGFEPVDEE